ncbi:hypothetical protein O1Q79_01840 [Lonepinella sp. MS14434]
MTNAEKVGMSPEQSKNIDEFLSLFVNQCKNERLNYNIFI